MLWSLTIEDMSQSTLLDVAREMIAQNRKKLGSAEFWKKFLGQGLSQRGDDKCSIAAVAGEKKLVAPITATQGDVGCNRYAPSETACILAMRCDEIEHRLTDHHRLDAPAAVALRCRKRVRGKRITKKSATRQIKLTYKYSKPKQCVNLIWKTN